MTESRFNIDQKGRVALGKIIPEGTTTLKGYYDPDREEIILKPYTEVPISTWLLNHPNKLADLKTGINDVKKGRVKRYSSVKDLLKELGD